MKSLITLVLTICTLTVFAQCDDAFFPFNEGVSFEQTAYDKKGKEQGKSMSEVVSVDGSSAVVKNVYFDKKGKEIADGEYTIICEGSTIKMDFNNFIPEGTLDQYGDAEVNVEGDFISIPDNLEVGQTLPDGTGTITIKMTSTAAMTITMEMTITDRKVEKSETIKTPAGSFDTFKISQTTIMKMNMMGMNKTTETSAASWYAKGVGMVRNENYDKKGSLMGYTQLTAFNK